jgi:hypothetical protein
MKVAVLLAKAQHIIRFNLLLRPKRDTAFCTPAVPTLWPNSWDHQDQGSRIGEPVFSVSGTPRHSLENTGTIGSIDPIGMSSVLKLKDWFCFFSFKSMSTTEERSCMKKNFVPQGLNSQCRSWVRNSTGGHLGPPFLGSTLIVLLRWRFPLPQVTELKKTNANFIGKLMILMESTMVAKVAIRKVRTELIHHRRLFRCQWLRFRLLQSCEEFGRPVLNICGIFLGIWKG